MSESECNNDIVASNPGDCETGSLESGCEVSCYVSFWLGATWGFEGCNPHEFADTMLLTLSNPGNSIKYLQIINPNENATIHWEIMMNGSEKDSYQVQCSAFWKGKVCFKFVGGFR